MTKIHEYMLYTLQSVFQSYEARGGHIVLGQSPENGRSLIRRIWEVFSD